MLSVSCQKCGAKHSIEEGRVPATGLLMKCSACSKPMTVMPGAGIGEELDLDSPARGPALSSFDDDEGMDLLAPVGPTGRGADIVDLPAPRGPVSNDIVDLPAPKGPTPTRAAPMLDVPDLLQPVGPASRKGGPGQAGPDLLAPVGPKPTRNAPDLLAPVGPSATAKQPPAIPDLLTPVGPASRKGGPGQAGPDLLAPVGPKPTRNAPDLLTPVGPSSTKSVDLTPVGATPTKGGIDLLTPVGPSASGNAVAPKGFFDDAPPHAPKPLGDALELDELDLAPPGAPPISMAAPSLDLDAPPASGPAPFALEGMDLSPPDQPAKGASPPQGGVKGMDYGEVDLGHPDESAASVISFTKSSGGGGGGGGGASASAAAKAKPASDMLDIADSPARKKGTTAGDDEAAVINEPRRDKRGGKEAPSPTVRAKKVKTPEQVKRQKYMLGGLAVLVVLGGAGFFFKMRLDEKAKRQKTIQNGLIETRKLIASDEDKHWDRAFDAAQRVLKVDPKNGDALGLSAQSRLAAAQDEGTARDARGEEAVGILTQAIKAGASGPEFDKAQALKILVVDERAADAVKALGTVYGKTRDGDTALYLAWAHMANNDAAQAKPLFEAALQRSPGRLPALYGLARAQLMLGDHEGAKKTFAELSKKRSTHIGMRVGLAEMLPQDRTNTRELRFLEIVQSAEAKDADPRILSHAWRLAGDEQLAAERDALGAYQKAVELDKDNLDAQVGIGYSLLAKGALDEAKTQFDAVLHVDPKNLRAYLGLARVGLKTSRETGVAEARSAIDFCLANAPDNAEVQFWHGQVSIREGGKIGLANAESAFRKSIGKDPNRIDSKVALARLLLDRAADPATDPADKAKLNEEAKELLAPLEAEADKDKHLANQLGLAYLASGEPKTARRYFEKALALDKDYVDALSNLGLALAADTPPDPVGALARFQEAYDKDPSGREDIAIRLALALERAKNITAAEAVFAKLLQAKAPSLPALAAAGRFYARHKNWVRVEELAARIAALDPKDPAALYLQGELAIQKREFGVAQKLLGDAVLFDPQAQYFEALGRAHMGMKAYEDALRAYNRALALDPAWTDAYIGSARIKIEQYRQYDLAGKDLDAAQKLEPGNPIILVMKGDSLYGRLKFKEAEAPYLEALKINPELAEGHFKLGRVYWQLSRIPDAVKHLAIAVELLEKQGVQDPWIIEAYYLLGTNQKKAGNNAGMCKAFKTYLEIAPKSASERREVQDKFNTRCQGY